MIERHERDPFRCADRTRTSAGFEKPESHNSSCTTQEMGFTRVFLDAVMIPGRTHGRFRMGNTKNPGKPGEISSVSQDPRANASTLRVTDRGSRSQPPY